MFFLLLLLTFIIFIRLLTVFGNNKYVDINNVKSNKKQQMKDVNTHEKQNEHDKFLALFPEYRYKDYIVEFEKLFDDVFYAFAGSQYTFLKQHVDKKVYEAFSTQIEKRQNAGLRQELEIKHLSTNIAQVFGDKSVIVIFEVSQMSAMFNYDNISEDNPHKIFVNVRHEWTMKFENGNWIVIQTKAREN